jgi:hypothetical protein
VPEEDQAASREAGHYVAKDVDYVHVTPPYSKDLNKFRVSAWFPQLQKDMSKGRILPEWVELYKKSYDAWKRGEEAPLNGTPIKGWGVISPAQQETLIRMTILTVEDLAAVNDEGIKRIGMAGLELKNKARAWLAQLNDKGPLTMEVAAVNRENALLKGEVETLKQQVAQLAAIVQAGKPEAPEPVKAEKIAVEDILPEEDPAAAYAAKFGKVPHHRMKRETILAALKE